MTRKRGIDPGIKLIIVMLSNLLVGMVFITLCGYFTSNFDIDTFGAAFGLVSVSLALALYVVFEVVYIVNIWRYMHSYRVPVFEYKLMCKSEFFAE